MNEKLNALRILIRNKRTSKDWCQEAMAIELGISQSAYANLENGKTQISLEKLINIISLLEISAEEFFTIIHQED